MIKYKYVDEKDGVKVKEFNLDHIDYKNLIMGNWFNEDTHDIIALREYKKNILSKHKEVINNVTKYLEKYKENSAIITGSSKGEIKKSFFRYLQQSGIRINSVGEIENIDLTLNEDSKIIFMDFDGVINNGDRSKDIANSRIHYVSVDNLLPLTKLLCWCYTNNVKIIVSSSWCVFGLHSIKDSLKVVLGDELVDSIFIDAVSYRIYHPEEYPHRSFEVNEYIVKHTIDSSFNKYCFLDDEESYIESDRERLIKTDPMIGVTLEDVDKVIAFFENKEYENKNKGYEEIKSDIIKWYIDQPMFKPFLNALECSKGETEVL